MIRVSQHDQGRRLFVGGHRVHHWHFGMAVIAAGAVLIALDLDDFMEWALR